MPRYYFNLIGEEATLLDHKGVEIAGDFGLLADTIIAEFVRTLVGLIRSEDPDLLRLWDGWWIEIVDVEGRALAKFPVRKSACH